MSSVCWWRKLNEKEHEGKELRHVAKSCDMCLIRYGFLCRNCLHSSLLFTQGKTLENRCHRPLMQLVWTLRSGQCDAAICCWSQTLFPRTAVIGLSVRAGQNSSRPSHYHHPSVVFVLHLVMSLTLCCAELLM